MKKGIPQFDLAKLNALFSPAAMRQLNEFIEQLPARLGINTLMMAAAIWAGAAAIVFYTTIQARQMMELRATLAKTEALKPPVPTIAMEPVEQAAIDEFVKATKLQYGTQGLSVAAEGNKLTFAATSGAAFPRFREAILSAFNGGRGWRLTLVNMCVGRECGDKSGAGFLSAAFTVSQYQVKPAESGE